MTMAMKTILRDAENEGGTGTTVAEPPIAAPPPTPSPEGTETPAAAEAEPFDDFLQDDMDDTDDVPEEETPKVEEPAPTVAPAEPTAPEVEPAPAVEPTAPEAVPVTPAAEVEPAPQAPVAPTVEPQPPTEPAVLEPEPQYTTEQVLDQYRTWREGTIDSLAKGHYALSEELVEQLEESPAQVVPKLLAGVYMDAVTDARNQMIRELPGLMQGALLARDANAEGEKGFYKVWPQLDTPEHRQVVLRMAGIYRQINPTTDLDTMTREVGAQVMVALRMPFDPNAPVEPTATPAPAAVVVPAVAVAPAFKPAAASSPRAIGDAPVAANPFTVLAEEELAEDDNF